MRRLIASLVLSIFFLLPAARTLAIAPIQDVCRGAPNASVCTQNPGGTNEFYGPGGILDSIINIISVVVGVVAVFAIVVAGFQFIVSGGDSNRVSSARNTIIYAIVGLVIVGIAQLVEAFVINQIGIHM